jgi:HEAT repeat protein
VAPLITALSDGNRDVRKNAAEVLGNLYLSGQLDDFSKNLISQQLHLLRMLNQT